MNTLLTILNNPKESKNTIRYATNLASNLGVNLHLLYTESPDSYPLGTPGTTGVAVAQVQKNLVEITAQAKTTIDKYVAEIIKEGPNSTKIESSTEVGSTSVIANKMVEADKAHMVLLENTMEDGFLSASETSMDIIRDVKAPVWVIPDKYTYEPFSEIVYATDYKEEDIETMKKVIDLTKRFSPKITALHITDSVDFDERVRKTGFNDLVRDKTRYAFVSVKSIIEKSKSETAHLINDYALMINAKLIVVLKENKAFLEQIFTSSETKKILKSANVPVLIYHEKE